jgi:hypothetical protein
MQEQQTDKKRDVVSSFDDNQKATVAVAKIAERGLAIYTPDLEPGVYDHEEFLAVVKRLVLSKRYARVRVLISNPGKAIRNGNRLVTLGRRLNSYIEFRDVLEEYREDHREAFIIADDRALMYRADAAKWEGMVGLNEPAIARQHLEVFKKIWQVSEYKNELRQLSI